MNTLESLNLSLQSLVLFRNLLGDDVIQKFCDLLRCADLSAQERVSRYAAFVSALYRHSDNFGEFILNLILEDENVYVLKRAQEEPIGDELERCLAYELVILQQVSRLTPQEVRTFIRYDGYLPGWKTADIDFPSVYQNRMDGIAAIGYGMYSKYHMFRLVDGVITPVNYPDPIRLTDLMGYELERKAVLDNTLALIKGKPAANALLYGDAGTGKSSTVKAIVNAYHSQGLRLIQITPDQFFRIPMIMENLIKNPLKFILFIDDLSFAEHNDEFTALKAILEGSVSQKAPNVVIYATSNRMHLVKELFSERDGDDIHRNETIEEMSSLSERFGLSVSFLKPDQALYLKIVHGLKEQYNIPLSDVRLDLEAERFALLRGGRSPRVARQFVEYLLTVQA